MRLERNGKSEIIITGNIKSLDDSGQIKDSVNALLAGGNNHLQLKIVDSLSMTSTVIGFLMKLVHQDKLHLTVSVGDKRLYTLLEELCLLQKFNVHFTGRGHVEG